MIKGSPKLHLYTLHNNFLPNLNSTCSMFGSITVICYTPGNVWFFLEFKTVYNTSVPNCLVTCTLFLFWHFFLPILPTCNTLLYFDTTTFSILFSTFSYHRLQLLHWWLFLLISISSGGFKGGSQQYSDNSLSIKGLYNFYESGIE